MVDEIKKAYLFWAGDPSVGIFDQEITLKDDNGNALFDLSVYSDEDKKYVIEDFRKSLAETFELSGDGQPNVIFDFEIMDDEIKETSLKVRQKSDGRVFDVKYLTKDEYCVLIPFPLKDEGDKILECWQPKERFEPIN